MSYGSTNMGGGGKRVEIKRAGIRVGEQLDRPEILDIPIEVQAVTYNGIEYGFKNDSGSLYLEGGSPRQRIKLLAIWDNISDIQFGRGLFIMDRYIYAYYKLRIDRRGALMDGKDGYMQLVRYDTSREWTRDNLEYLGLTQLTTLTRADSSLNITHAAIVPYQDALYYLTPTGTSHIVHKLTPVYEVVRDTSSIPNPKRKNLSAKFDVLPDVLT